MDGWLGDELLESTPCFIATRRLADALQAEAYTGFTIDVVEVTASEQFHDLHRDLSLPAFVWLKIDGEPCQDDFGLSADLHLVVSQRALDVLRSAIAHADIQLLSC